MDGDVRLGDLGATATLFDLRGRAIEVDISSPQALTSPHRILYWSHRLSNAVARQEGTEPDQYIADGEHPLLLVGAPGAKALLLETRARRFTVEWYTRCVASTPLSQQARQDLEELISSEDSQHSDQDFTPDSHDTMLVNSSSSNSPPSSPTPGGGRPLPRQAALRSLDTLRTLPLQSSSPSSASSDFTFLGSDDAPVVEDSSEEESESDDDEEILSSETWRGEEGYSPGNLRHLAQRLRSNRTCRCAGVRQITISCPTRIEAQNIHRALSRPHLAGEVDPEAILPGDPHTMTVRQYVAARHPRTIPAQGLFNTNIRIKMIRFPTEIQHDDGRNAAPAPIQPWWFGLWTGDGTHDSTVVSCSTQDLPVIRGKIQQIVGGLNAARRAGTAPLHLWQYENRQSNVLNAHASVWQLAITSTVPGVSLNRWNPFRATMQQLDVLNNNKRHGIPPAFRNARKEDRAALLAGLIDSDGSTTNNRTAYRLTQSLGHRLIVEHAREVALGLGIAVSALNFKRSPHPLNPAILLEQVEIKMYGPNLALLQPYVVIERKRLRPVWINTEMRVLRIEEVEGDGPIMGRQIRLQGHEATTVQLREGYVVYADTARAE